MPHNNKSWKQVRLCYTCECPCGWIHNASSKKGQTYMENFHCRVCEIGRDAKSKPTTLLMTKLDMDTGKKKITNKIVVSKL